MIDKWNPVNSPADWPDKDTSYLVTLRGYEYVEMAYISSIRGGERRWCTDMSQIPGEDLLAWMPVPERYVPFSESEQATSYRCKQCKTPLENEGSFSTFVCGHMDERANINDLIEIIPNATLSPDGTPTFSSNPAPASPQSNYHLQAIN